MSQWFTRFFRRTPQRPLSKSAARRHGFRPRLEALEDRLVLSTFTVNSLADTLTPPSGTVTLRSAAAEAQNGDTINFDSSVFSQPTNTIDLTLGEIQVANGVTIDNETGHTIAIDGTNNSSRIFEILGDTAGVSAVINNLALNNSTITGGSGGAVLVDGGAGLTLNNDTFMNDTALIGTGTNVGFGGAIENAGDLTVNGSTFDSNVAQAGGGAIDSFSRGGMGNLTVTASNFFSNSAGTFGGAIDTNDMTTLDSDTFGATGRGNTAAGGGGAVDAFGGTPGTTMLTVSSSTFDSNQVNGTSGFGGGISTTDILDAEHNTFTNNSAPFGGGAIDYFIKNTTATGFSSSMTLKDNYFASNSGEEGGAVESDVNIASGSVTVDVSDNTFFQNHATGTGTFGFGGGLDIFHTTSGTGSATATVTNDTFFQNTSANHGGGLVVTDTNTGTGTNTAALTSLTVTGNQAATDGGGLYISGGNVSVNNTILSANTVTATGFSGPEDLTVASGALDDQGFNLVGTTDTQFTATTNVITDDPGLATALAQNGAPAGVPPTLAPQAGSEAIGNGDPNLANTPDERGFIRQTGEVSIGAEDPNAIQP